MSHSVSNRVNLCYDLTRSASEMMFMNSDFRKRLTAFARNLDGPVGRIPLDRAIRRDLELFAELRSTGTTWTQIAQALASVGARRPGGGIISADHLRGAISRQMKRQSPSPVTKPPVTKLAADDTARGIISASRPKRSAAPSASTAQDMVMPIAKEAVSLPPASSERGSRPNASFVLAKLARTKRLRES